MKVPLGNVFSGKYKELPVAVKVFKDKKDCKAVHSECDILTLIPGHPNIAMLMGVFTVERPFLLLTKLCTSEGQPKTYACVLRQWSKSKTVNLKVFLSICLEDAINSNVASESVNG